MDRVDCVVIGAGVIGLACARAIVQAGLDVVIVEREAAFGTGVSARSSEVIHAGLHHAPGSRKAQWCVRGARLLYDYCEERGIAHRRCGKLLVATRDADIGALEALRVQGLANGVDGLAWLTRAQAQAIEPELDCVAALSSPSSGIVDSHGLMTALLGDAERCGALLAVASEILGAVREGELWRIRVRAGGTDCGSSASAPADFELHSRWVINATGLDSQAVAASIEGFPASAIPPRHLARGHYFSLAGRSPFSRLIYPMPVDGGLGVHLTLDLGGQARFGPDVEWLDGVTPAATSGRDLDYKVDATRADAFTAQVRRYWPRLPDGALAPGYSGIRPKLSGPGKPAADFRVDGPADHGCPGVVQLFGIESPGLTSSMAIAEFVAATVARGSIA
ncbi:MAG: NAD(P)/FAD-dependent oxidoreductase [Burkholderiaceae bacterium]|nr:NAD(P)/FAD-dependent oxidoreductase [Burkholderiaceae bacterium]